jgi:hypothetical protein
MEAELETMFHLGFYHFGRRSLIAEIRDNDWMSQSTLTTSQPSTEPLKLTASAVNYLIKRLPKGTAYCIGIVLVVMMTGRLVQSKGSLARAVLPLVFHLKWGWHRVERAMERGKVPLDKMFERAFSSG